MEGTNGSEIGSSFKTDFVKQTVEKTPFTTNPARNFFAKWCEINDSIVPKFTSREEWDQRGRLGILEKNDQGKQTLFLPHDLHLWEMVDVIKTVDHDTLANSPEKRDQRADKIKGLGEIFEKAGQYLSEYLPDFKENNDGSKQMVEDLANNFYQYGLSLQHKEQVTSEIPKDSILSLEDKVIIDEWFLGKDIYQKRLARLGENPSVALLEETRKTTLQTYFKALTRKGYKADGTKPWETKIWPTQHLQDKSQEQIIKAIEIPEAEMRTAFFRRGVEKLVTEIKTNLLFEKRKLYDVIGIDKLKQKLEEVKTTTNIAKISAKELEIAKKIQKAVSSFHYEDNANNPSEMVKTKVVNCVGSSVLGGGLLEKVGINYLHASLSGHSATVLITSDGKAYWQDFTPGRSYFNYKEITPDIIQGDVDLNNLSNTPDGITIIFKENTMESNQVKVDLFNPEAGLQSHILHNTGNALSDLGRDEEALEAYKQAISINPKLSYPYSGIGNALSNLGRYEESIDAYKQAIRVDPKFSHPYNGMGNVLSDLGRYEESIDAYKQAINVDPKDVYSYNVIGNALSNLGKYEEALEAYKQVININPKDAIPYYGIGNALSDLGRYDEAIVNYETFIELWKGDETLLNTVKEKIEKLKQKQNI